MTTVYFVRHAQSDHSIHDDMLRPLTPKGLKDSENVTAFLQDKTIDMIFSSPCKRAIDTVKHLSQSRYLSINAVRDLRERETGAWVDDFVDYAKKQWSDFGYKLQGGESLNEVQTRNIGALFDMIKRHQNENIVVASHGTAISSIINYFETHFGFDDFLSIKDCLPFIVCMTFDGQEFQHYSIHKL